MRSHPNPVPQAGPTPNSLPQAGRGDSPFSPFPLAGRRVPARGWWGLGARTAGRLGPMPSTKGAGLETPVEVCKVQLRGVDVEPAKAGFVSSDRYFSALDSYANAGPRPARRRAASPSEARHRATPGWAESRRSSRAARPRPLRLQAVAGDRDDHHVVLPKSALLRQALRRGNGDAA